MNNTGNSPYDVAMISKILSNRRKPYISTISATGLSLGIMQSNDNKNEILEKNNMK